MKQVKLTAEGTEIALIGRIVKRAKIGIDTIDALSLIMDIDAVNSNGCKLSLERLLTFPDFDFYHDVLGIQNNLNRETGKLENCFFPRCAIV